MRAGWRACFGHVARFLVFSASLLLAQDHPPVASASPELIEKGRLQFAQSCSFCHGLEAAGGAQGPNLIRSSLVRHDVDGDLITRVITNGRPQKGMLPIALTNDQIAAVIAFLHARVKKSDLASPKQPGQNFDLQRLLTGNAAAGKVYFNGAGKCSACHSPVGDLAHLATKYAPPELQARFLYPESDAPLQATILLSSGLQIHGTLVDEDHFSVGVHDEQGWYHSWPRSQVQVQIVDPLAPHVALLAQYSNADIHNLFAYLETLK